MLPDSLEPLQVAIERGLRLRLFVSFWLEVGALADAAVTEIELPRGANVFFGYDFETYTDETCTIGHPIVWVGRSRTARTLTWRGDRQTETISVTPPSQGGDVLHDRVVLFRREGSAFSMTVVDAQSAEHTEWKQRSKRKSTVFRLGDATVRSRRCGVF